MGLKFPEKNRFLLFFQKRFDETLHHSFSFLLIELIEILLFILVNYEVSVKSF